MDELGAAIREVILYDTIRGKFSSVHPDLMKQGITKVEVEEKGLFFISNNDSGEHRQYPRYEHVQIVRGGVEGGGWDGDNSCPYRDGVVEEDRRLYPTYHGG